MNVINFISAKKVKISPSKSQGETFTFWMRRCKKLYNVALEEKIMYYKATSKYLNVYEQKKELVDIKAYDQTWKNVPNKSLQEIIFRVDKAFKTFFNSGGFPKYQSELNTIEFAKTDVRLKEGKLYLPKIKECIKYTEDIKEGWTSVKLTKNKEKFYLVFMYSQDKVVEPLNNDVLGIDLGLMSLYTDSNGHKAKRFSKKLVTKYHDRIATLNRSLSTKNKGSIKFKKVKKQLNKAYDRLKDTKCDYLHQESLKLVKNNLEGVIALGDIKIKSIINNTKSKKGMIKSFYTTSLGIFKQYVKYKAVKYNKECLLIDEYMTSKTCSCCGNVKYDLELSTRTYECSNCTISIDRDVNSGINMKMLGSSILLSREKLNKVVSLSE